MMHFDRRRHGESTLPSSRGTWAKLR
jgi:hypothetical protein